MVDDKELLKELYYLAGGAGGCVLVLIIWNIYLTFKTKELNKKIREIETKHNESSGANNGFEIPRARVNSPAISSEGSLQRTLTRSGDIGSTNNFHNLPRNNYC